MDNTDVSADGDGYFGWQGPLSQLGGWANAFMFAPYVGSEDRVIDFGCGGGDLLAGLTCAERLGIEINAAARIASRHNGLQVVESLGAVDSDSFDVVLSSHALAQVEAPLAIASEMWRVLKPGGRVVIVVHCESSRRRFAPQDINGHMYTWSPSNLGHLFRRAGFVIRAVDPVLHAWPPRPHLVARAVGETGFHILSRARGYLDRRLVQVRLVGQKAAR